MIALLLALGCGGGSAVDPADLVPEPIGLAECAVCGMVVGEQPAPRGQLIYRDGTCSHICSLDETRALAAAPGPQGRPVAVFVEALPSDFDWAQTPTDPLPWNPAESSYFVYGAERSRVMGTPILSFADPGAARAAAEALGSTPVRWADLLRTPVPEVPPEAGWTPKKAPHEEQP